MTPGPYQAHGDQDLFTLSLPFLEEKVAHMFSTLLRRGLSVMEQMDEEILDWDEFLSVNISFKEDVIRKKVQSVGRFHRIFRNRRNFA